MLNFAFAVTAQSDIFKFATKKFFILKKYIHTFISNNFIKFDSKGNINIKV